MDASSLKNISPRTVFAILGAIIVGPFFISVATDDSMANDWSDEECVAVYGTMLMDDVDTSDAVADYSVHCCETDPGAGVDDGESLDFSSCRP